MFKAVVNKGGQVKICGTCAEGRGIHKLVLMEGAEISTMSQLAQWVVDSEKVLTFCPSPFPPTEWEGGEGADCSLKR